MARNSRRGRKNPANVKRGRNAKARGKNEERNSASALNAEPGFEGEDFRRNPDNGTKVADLESENYVVEVKSQQKPTYALIKRAWSQALAAHRGTGKHPLIVLTFVDEGRRVRWLVQRLGDFE